MQACLQSLQRCSLSSAKLRKNILLNKVVLNKVVKNMILQRYWFMIIRARNILKAIFVSQDSLFYQ